MRGSICITVMLDTKSILEQNPSPSQDPCNPSSIADRNGMMMAPSAYVEDGQASNSLRLRANECQPVRWRTVTPANQSGQVPVLYNVADAVQPGTDPWMRVIAQIVTIPHPIVIGGRNTDPPSFGTATAMHYYLHDRSSRKGTRILRFMFYIVGTDRKTSELALKGYFEWTAALTLMPADAPQPSDGDSPAPTRSSGSEEPGTDLPRQDSA